MLEFELHFLTFVNKIMLIAALKDLCSRLYVGGAARKSFHLTVSHKAGQIVVAGDPQSRC